MANRLYNRQVTPKGYKKGGRIGGVKTKTTTTTTTKSEKKPGFFRRTIGKVRKKFIPTFDEQFSKAKKEGKKTFTSTRDKSKKGKLEYSTKTAAEVKAAKKRMSDRERARVGDTSKQLSEKGAAFKLARKMGKKEFTHKGKKFTTLLKGEKPSKILPELSGKTSKKIKKFVGA
jgi:hypothetical protein